MNIIPQIAVLAERPISGGDLDVASIASSLVSQGATALQLRILDGITGDVTALLDRYEHMSRELRVPIQLDGSVDSSSALDRCARRSFATVVLSMGAATDPLLVRWALDVLGDRLVVEVLGDGDTLYVDASRHGTPTLVEFVRQLEVQGVHHVLYRDVTGMEVPVNLLRSLCDDVELTFSFAGSVHSMTDIRLLRTVDRSQLRSVIIGEPLMDGAIDLAEAQALLA